MCVVRAKKLRKEYGTLVAVDDLDISIDQGQVVGLIGPNGAGKTTLIRMLATVLHPTDGSAEILGNHLTKDHLKIAKSIGYLPDFFNLYNDLTLEECLRYFARSYDMPKERIPDLIDKSLDYVGLQSKKKDFIRHLSRGMVQRLGVATLMVREPELYILDEPASGLDPKARIQLRKVLQQLSSDGKTVIISSHILTELSGFCSHIAIMDEGKLVQYGSVDEMERNIMRTQHLKVTVLNNIDKAKDIITRTSGMKLVNEDGCVLTAEFQGDSKSIASLNSELVKSEIEVAALSEDKTNLEDLFLKIAQGDKES